MPEEHRSVYCGRCGNALQEGDEFCGVCGAPVQSHAPATGPTQEIPSPAQPPTRAAAAGGGRRRVPRWVVPVVLLAVMVGSTGALAYAALGPGGGTEQQAPEPEAGAPPAANEEPTTPSVSPYSPPDPAFDLLLPTLKRQTTAPIMLPAELPNEFENAGVDEGVEGDSYAIAFLATPPDRLLGSWARAETVADLRAVPESEYEPSRFVEATSTQSIRLPDGTEAELRRMEPVSESANYGPYWEGTFDKDGYAYSLSTNGDAFGKGTVEQALSTMVLVRGGVSGGAEEPTAPSPAQPDPDEEALEGFGYEYDAANRRGDWAETYAMLEEGSQQEFTEGEWAEKQQALREVDGVPAPLESVTVDLEETSSDAPGTVSLNYKDGTRDDLTVTTFRTVYDPNDDGGPRLILSDAQISYLRGVPVDGNPQYAKPESTGTGDLAAQAEEAAGDYYRAAGSQDWDYTYDALDSGTQALFTREEWSQKNQWFVDNGTTIYHIESARPDGASPETLVEVDVRLTGEDGSSSVRTTYFVNEDGEWKHRFGQEETDLFMPGTPYEKFVAAQG